MKSHSDYKSHKLQKEEARKLLGRMIREDGINVLFSKHAREELKKDGLGIDDAIDVLASTEARILKDAEFENGTYRYRVETSSVCLVIVFNSVTELIVITAWRKK
jgi:hypothetical protein